MRRSTVKAGLLRAVTTAAVSVMLLTVPGTAHAAPVAPAPADTAPAPEPRPEPQPHGDHLDAHADESHSDEPTEMVTPEPTDGLEDGDEVAGEVVRIADGPEHAPDTFVETEDGDLVPVQSDALEEVPVGSEVSVVLGEPVPVPVDATEATFAEREAAAVQVVDQAPETPEVADPVEPSTAGATTLTNQVTLVMVLPAGAVRDGATPEQATAQIDGEVATYWNRESNGAVRLGVVAAHDWVTSAKNCTDTSIWTDVAAAIGWSSGAGKHLALYFPPNTPNCNGAAGLGSVGTSPSTGGRLWSAGGLDPDFLDVWAHEFGHNFGLRHAGRSDCVNGIETGTCQVVAYGDEYDIMGYGGRWRDGALNLAHAARLGFLPADQQQTLAHSAVGGSYTLAPTSSRSGMRGLRLTTSTGATYWLEYRTATGADAWIDRHWAKTYPHLPYRIQYAPPEGVLLRQSLTGLNTSMLYDVTPAATSAELHSSTQVAFPIGTPVAVAGGEFTVTVQRTAVGEATVHVATATTPPAPAATALQTAYQTWYASSGLLGLATGPETCTLPDGGCMQSFQYGAATTSPTAGTHYVATEIGAKWTVTGGPTGLLGYPVTDPETDYACFTSRSRCTQTFQHGTVLWTPAAGATAFTAPFYAAYTAAGGSTGSLGNPTGDTDCTLPDGGCSQTFSGGTIVWSARTGARTVTGAVLTRYTAAQGPAGMLGYPVEDAGCTSSGCRQRFQRGWIVWSAGTGARTITGATLIRYAAAGGEQGALRYPVEDASCTSSGCRQRFQRGWIVWSARTGARTVTGVTLTRYAASGAEQGALSYPVEDTTCTVTGCRQKFRGGTIYSSTRGGTRIVSGSILTRYRSLGAERGRYGYPISEVYDVPGGRAQRFQGGTLTHSGDEVR